MGIFDFISKKRKESDEKTKGKGKKVHHFYPTSSTTTKKPKKVTDRTTRRKGEKKPKNEKKLLQDFKDYCIRKSIPDEKLNLIEKEIDDLKWLQDEDQRRLSWERICNNKELFQEFVKENKDKVDWKLLCSEIAYYWISEKFIREFQDKVDWKELSKIWTLHESFSGKDKIELALDSGPNPRTVTLLIIPFSQEFAKDFRDKIDWTIAKKPISMLIEENKELKAISDSCIEKAKQCPITEKRDYIALASNAIYDATERDYAQRERDKYMIERLYKEDPILLQIYKDALKEAIKELEAKSAEKQEIEYRQREREIEREPPRESMVTKAGKAFLRSPGLQDATAAFWAVSHLAEKMGKDLEKEQKENYEKWLRGY
ncbi:MAG: hypothetical protein HY769_09995 [Candidatus Stahlbacteria bacterium]|nr:hypothetical protein [Candidatus Stahlbacteria bacterium]